MNDKLQSLWHTFIHSDLYEDFSKSPSAIISLVIVMMLVTITIFAPWLAPHNTLDMASLDLMDSELPPFWLEGGDSRFILGTDDQGRDLLSAIIYGTRLSCIVAGAAVLISLVFGVILGLIAGYFGGIVDAVIMRIVDIQLSLPAILLALLISGIATASLPADLHEQVAIPVLVASIAIATWVNYTRTVRSATMVQVRLEYVQAAKMIGFNDLYIMFIHILPNVTSPILVIATIDFAICILLEASLSFLGVGLPPTMPSLGTLIRVGSDYLFSGQWWVVFFSALVLFIITICINILGDRLRDIFNPKIQ